MGITTANVGADLTGWQQTVQKLAEQIAAWSQEEGWAVERTQEEVEDTQRGNYAVPALKIETPHGRLLLEPLSHSLNGVGRVNLSSWETLYRVRLLQGSADADWTILTDSGIPVRYVWGKGAFVTVAKDLLRAD